MKMHFLLSLCAQIAKINDLNVMCSPPHKRRCCSFKHIYQFVRRIYKFRNMWKFMERRWRQRHHLLKCFRAFTGHSSSALRQMITSRAKSLVRSQFTHTNTRNVKTESVCYYLFVKQHIHIYDTFAGALIWKTFLVFVNDIYTAETVGKTYSPRQIHTVPYGQKADSRLYHIQVHSTEQ